MVGFNLHNYDCFVLAQVTFLRIFFYLKLCYQRAYSYYGFAAQLVQLFGIVAVALHTFGYKDMRLIGAGFIIFVFGMFLFGLIDVRRGWARMEQSVTNRQNPELMEIKKMLEDILKQRENPGLLKSQEKED